MVKLYIALISIFVLVSCGARKVDVSKVEVKASIDSAVVIKVDGTYVKENNVVIEECVDEIEYIPADTSKPMVINGKKYINTIIKSKKQKKKTVDKTKVTDKVSFVKKLNVKRKDASKVAEKKTDRKQNYLAFIWLLLPFLIIAIIYRYGKSYFPMLKLRGLLER